MPARSSIAIASVALVLGLTACSTDAVSTSDLETAVSDQLEAQIGQAPDSVDCPDALDAEVGAEVRCTLTAEETTFGLTIIATSVDGSEVAFDIIVDDAPQG